MKVFIVGAGFSESAGYPLGSELLPSIGEFVEQLSSFVHLQNPWSDFVRWRDSQTDTGVKELINTGNVEFIITYLDLLDNAQDINRMQYYKKAKHLEWPDLSKVISERERKLEETGKFFSEAKTARDRLSWLLVHYFEHKNREDFREGECEYIVDICSHMVSEGDAFISFNYDGLVEKALHTLGMWSPQDGYGFECRLREGETWDNPKEIDVGHSPVKVLKLHGSVGWYKNKRNNKIFINWELLLKYFKGRTVRDAAEPPRTPEQYRHPVVIEPSFIKPIEQKELLDIWDEARKVLEEAKEVFILGYSMPQADASAQNLIVHSIRANPNRPKVTVVDPNQNTLDRYEELLGFQIEKQRSKVEEWAFSLVAH